MIDGDLIPPRLHVMIAFQIGYFVHEWLFALLRRVVTYESPKYLGHICFFFFVVGSMINLACCGER